MLEAADGVGGLLAQLLEIELVPLAHRLQQLRRRSSYPSQHARIELNCWNSQLVCASSMPRRCATCRERSTSSWRDDSCCRSSSSLRGQSWVSRVGCPQEPAQNRAIATRGEGRIGQWELEGAHLFLAMSASMYFLPLRTSSCAPRGARESR